MGKTRREGLWSAVCLALFAAWGSACAGGGGEPASGSGGADVAHAGPAGSAAGAPSASPPSSDDAGASASSVEGGVALPPSLALTVPCADAPMDVYVTPPGLPSFGLAARGDVVRCAKDADLSVADVATELSAKGLATKPTSGAHLYRVAYRTTRGNGAPGVSTARLYVPDAPRAFPLPVIVVAHPTEGLASSCAPSKDPASLEDQALPWASLGYAVIAPDYAGLGNDDAVQGYVDNHDTGYSALDAARALRKLFTPATLSQDVLAVGWSQGGGAVLSAQALERDYGSGGKLVGVIAFAPEWPTRDNSFGYVDLLKSTTDLTITKGVSFPTVLAMREYAYFSAYVGPDHATDAFPAASRAGLSGAITSLCQTPFGGYLQATFPKVGDLFDPGFHDALLACTTGAPSASACAGPAKGYHDFMQRNVLTADPAGAKILYVQGLADTIMPAASEGACNVQKLLADGVSPTVCADVAALHTTVVPRNMDFALSWGQAILAGDALPACPSALGLPPCTP